MNTVKGRKKLMFMCMYMLHSKNRKKLITVYVYVREHIKRGKRLCLQVHVILARTIPTHNTK